MYLPPIVQKYDFEKLAQYSVTNYFIAYQNYLSAWHFCILRVIENSLKKQILNLKPYEFPGFDRHKDLNMFSKYCFFDLLC